MIRLTFYILMSVIIAGGAAWVAGHPGEMMLNWQGWEIRMPFALIVGVIIAYTLLMWLLFKLIVGLKSVNPLKNPERLAKKRAKGLAELDLAWSALTLGDRTIALRHGRRAKNILSGESGPLMLLAQAESARGSKPYLEELKKHQETAAWVQKKQLEHLMDEQNFAGALLIAKEIQKNHPDSPWAKLKIFDLEARLGRWEEAELSLKSAVKSGVITPEGEKHFKSVLDYNAAMEQDAAGNKDAALTLCKAATKSDPAFIPAAIYAVRHLISSDDLRAARKILEKAWQAQPHPEMAIMFRELKPMESATERFRRAVKFTSHNPEHLESAHLVADVAITAEHWPDAQKALAELVKTGKATTKTYQLFARLEQKQKQDKSATEAYMKQASTAPVNPHWSCKDCGTDQQHYLPHCPTCSEFDSVLWGGKKA